MNSSGDYQGPIPFPDRMRKGSHGTSTDPGTGRLSMDGQKVVALPLLQSIFTETLRLRINFNIIRDFKHSTIMYSHTIPQGSLLQAPMRVVHNKEAVWAPPATRRPISGQSDMLEQVMGAALEACEFHGRQQNVSHMYFPFGGGAQSLKSCCLSCFGGLNKN